MHSWMNKSVDHGVVDKLKAKVKLVNDTNLDKDLMLWCDIERKTHSTHTKNIMMYIAHDKYIYFVDVNGIRRSIKKQVGESSISLKSLMKDHPHLHKIDRSILVNPDFTIYVDSSVFGENRLVMMYPHKEDLLISSGFLEETIEKVGKVKRIRT